MYSSQTDQIVIKATTKAFPTHKRFMAGVMMSARRVAKKHDIPLSQDAFSMIADSEGTKLVCRLDRNDPLYQPIIADIYTYVKKNVNERVTISPPDKGFKSEEEIADEGKQAAIYRKIEAVHMDGYKLFIRTDNKPNVITSSLPNVKNSPAQHMLLSGDMSDNCQDSGYLSLFDMINSESAGYKAAVEILSSHLHFIFIPEKVKEITLESLTVANEFRPQDRSSLLLNTAMVPKTFRKKVETDSWHSGKGDGELIATKAGGDTRVVDVHETLFCGDWPNDIIEITLIRSAQTLKIISDTLKVAKSIAEVYVRVKGLIEEKTIQGEIIKQQDGKLIPVPAPAPDYVFAALPITTPPTKIKRGLYGEPSPKYPRVAATPTLSLQQQAAALAQTAAAQQQRLTETYLEREAIFFGTRYVDGFDEGSTKNIEAIKTILIGCDEEKIEQLKILCSNKSENGTKKMSLQKFILFMKLKALGEKKDDEVNQPPSPVPVFLR